VFNYTIKVVRFCDQTSPDYWQIIIFVIDEPKIIAISRSKTAANSIIAIEEEQSKSA
jgi:hypothetical protein